jgi:hypothetical protein
MAVEKLELGFGVGAAPDYEGFGLQEYPDLQNVLVLFPAVLHRVSHMTYEL